MVYLLLCTYWFLVKGIALNKWKIIFKIISTPLIPSLPACAVSWLTFCSTYRDRLSNFINESRGKKGKISRRVAVNAPFWTARKRLQMTQSALMANIFDWLCFICCFSCSIKMSFLSCFKLKSRGKCTILDSQEKASNDPASFNGYFIHSIYLIRFEVFLVFSIKKYPSKYPCKLFSS